MPTYDYHCENCNRTEEIVRSMLSEDEVICSRCGRAMDRKISSNFGGFTIKGGSASIHWKEKRLRHKMNEEAGDRMKKKYGDSLPKVTPNVMGVPQESWSDCQKLAKECGMNSDSYQPMVDKEKKKKISVVKA